MHNDLVPTPTYHDAVEPEVAISDQAASVNTADNQQDLSPARDQSQSPIAIVTLRSFNCTFPGCPSKSFNRHYELERHMRKHNPHATYECTAIGCNRIGNKGFYRGDKLKDHVLAGHDTDSIFTCPVPSCTFEDGNPVALTKDLMIVHAESHQPYHRTVTENIGAQLLAFTRIESQRCCPIPRCPYRLNARKHSLDEIQKHLVSKHDSAARSKFKELMAKSGYDALTGHVVCPICTGGFPTHLEFYQHIIGLHLDMPQVAWDIKINPHSCVRCYLGKFLREWKGSSRLQPNYVLCEACPILFDGYPKYWQHLLEDHLCMPRLAQEIKRLPEWHQRNRVHNTMETLIAALGELRPHRRTILSLYPGFGEAAIWEDIQVQR
ncbi:hypothetical protein K469DRAFT_698584 [Zopfia rhizophila CBS 207.26]|uniref:C2H2-type domain-containing protein n=1 Tax=Zopfia rhizophila CBS 207.26 TaxID=1314779 RepID=A0A6A6ES97_9PEZI|nr:hypothetical protein K469DRAFT_698584 [Zopfia rhizophila CBS 207.26]